jgi:hypothetical protein
MGLRSKRNRRLVHVYGSERETISVERHAGDSSAVFVPGREAADGAGFQVNYLKLPLLSRKPGQTIWVRLGRFLAIYIVVMNCSASWKRRG